MAAATYTLRAEWGRNERLDLLHQQELNMFRVVPGVACLEGRVFGCVDILGFNCNCVLQSLHHYKVNIIISFVICV